jgi:hypothetical protein
VRLDQASWEKHGSGCARSFPQRFLPKNLTERRLESALWTLVITLAGPLAHRRLAPRSNWFQQQDIAIVLKMIFGKGNNATAADKQKLLEFLVEVTEKIVDYFWADIKVAAKALLKHGTLTGDEIAAVIREARRKSRRRPRTYDPPEFAASWRGHRRHAGVIHTKTRPKAGVNGRVSFPQRHSRPGAEAHRDE